MSMGTLKYGHGRLNSQVPTPCKSNESRSREAIDRCAMIAVSSSYAMVAVRGSIAVITDSIR